MKDDNDLCVCVCVYVCVCVCVCVCGHTCNKCQTVQLSLSNYKCVCVWHRIAHQQPCYKNAPLLIRVHSCNLVLFMHE